jgi:hypothetical protein
VNVSAHQATVTALAQRWAEDPAAPAGLPALLELCGADVVAVLGPDGEIQADLVRPGVGVTIDQPDIDLVVFDADPGEHALAEPVPPARWAAAGITRTRVQVMPAEAGVMVVAWTGKSSPSSGTTSPTAMELALSLFGERVARTRAEGELADRRRVAVGAA